MSATHRVCRRTEETCGCKSALLLHSVIEGATLYFLTSLPVLLGVLFADSFVSLCREHPLAEARMHRPLSGLVAWDGDWYCDIVDNGYSFRPHEMSNVAFFPVFPLLARLAKAVLSLSAEASVVLTSNAAAFASFVLFSLYLRRRWGHGDDAARHLSLAVFGLFPTTFFWRMGYSDSTFLALGLLFSVLLTRRTSPYLLALVVGALCAAKPPGIAFLAPLLLEIWEQKRAMWAFFRTAATACLLAATGIGVFIAYQWIAFGEPFAFLKTQAVWNTRPLPGPARLFFDLLTLEPLRATYDPAIPLLYWGWYPPRGCPEFNIMFWTPPLFLLSVASAIVGWRRGLLTRAEFTIALLLCLIPYGLQGPRAGVASLGRYCSVAFPVYMVLGRALAHIPHAVAAALCAILGVMLFAMSALFSKWYWIY